MKEEGRFRKTGFAIRVEDSEGIGIFRSSLTFDGYTPKNDVADRIDNAHMRFKTPYNEPKLEDTFSEKHRCAYRTIVQMNSWLSSCDIQDLKNLGFKIYLLELSDFKEGDFQIIYEPKDIVNKKDISELF